MLKLNSSGITHFLALALLVVGASTFGSYQLVAKRNVIDSAVKPNIELSAGARLDGTPVGEHTELQVQSKATIIVKATIQNLDQKKTERLSFKNNIPGGLTMVPGTLTVNGKAVKSSTRNVTLDPLEFRGFHDISYKAVVKASSPSCDKILTNTISVKSGRNVAATKSIKLTICGAVAEVKTKPVLDFKYGAQTALGVISEIVIKQGDQVNFTAEVTNVSNKEVKNALVSISGFQGKGMRPEPGTLSIDGKATSTELLSRVRLGTMAPNAKKTITFTAFQMGDAKFCDAKKLVTKANLVASGVPTQHKTTTLELC